MPELTENQALIDTAQLAVEPVKIAEGLYLTRDQDGTVEVKDARLWLQDDLALDHPRRKTGDRAVTDVTSLIAYLAKHGLPETELWGNRDAGTIRAVINAHDGAVDNATAVVDADGQIGIAGWGDHTVTLKLNHSDDWKEWTARDGAYLPQTEFAEFIEDHLPNLKNASDLLELAQTFRATTKVDFGSTSRLKSGETAIEYVETVDAKAGKKGQLSIPDSIDIALPVYDQGAIYTLTARLRYRVNGANLALGYKLNRPRDMLQAAFGDVVLAVEEDTARTVWATA